MAEILSNNKIIYIRPYIDDIFGEFEKLPEQDKIQILEKAFDVMGKSCQINASNSLFYKTFFSRGGKNSFYIRKEASIDPDYQEHGSVGGMAIHFTIEDKSIRGSVFLGNLSGMAKYSTFGLQKIKETVNETNYYHILDGAIISVVTCHKESSLLEELSCVQTIKPFKLEQPKKYKVKRKECL